MISYPPDDKDFIDFIEKCLEIDPDQRLTPESALKHPWLKNYTIRSVLKENDNSMENAYSEKRSDFAFLNKI